MTIVVFGTLRFPATSMDKVREPLRALVEATRKHDGCSAYDVAEDLFEPGLIRFSEIWPDAETLAKHLKADHIAPWRAVCSELDLQQRRFIAYEAENPKAV